MVLKTKRKLKRSVDGPIAKSNRTHSCFNIFRPREVALSTLGASHVPTQGCHRHLCPSRGNIERGAPAADVSPNQIDYGTRYIIYTRYQVPGSCFRIIYESALPSKTRGGPFVLDDAGDPRRPTENPRVLVVLFTRTPSWRQLLLILYPPAQVLSLSYSIFIS